MDDPLQSPPDLIRFNSRSMGAKLIAVCGLAVLMAVPAIYINALVGERTARAAQVVREVSAYSGGPQTFLGPTLAVPYKNDYSGSPYFIFPAEASASVKTATEERHRSLFRVPVFQAEVLFDATFDLAAVSALTQNGSDLDWSRAEIVVGVSDARGAIADATLSADGATTPLTPAETAPEVTIGGSQNAPVKLALFGKRIEGLERRHGIFNVSSSLRFSGAQRVAVLSYGKTTHVTEQGDWPSPGFDGGFLPVKRTVGRAGFTAEWSVPFIARGVRAEGPAAVLGGLQATALGTSFVEVADPYQSISRSVKYALLFVGLVFLTYFAFEASTGRRVHPAQYILVGVAQAIFYLLLLSTAEKAGFDLGFLVAGTATVALLSFNASWVFSDGLHGARASVVFSLLYGLIYLLLRLDDYALLMSSVASFLAVGAAMYLTRRIDWYGTGAKAPTTT